MEGFSFLIQRFFISFISGCIITLYGRIYIPWIKNLLSDTLVFAIVSIFFGVFIEGLLQIGAEQCFKSSGKTKSFSQCFLYYIFETPTIFKVSKDLDCLKDQQMNPMNGFINEIGLDNSPRGKTYDAVARCAMAIESTGKMHNLYRYRDTSFMLQMTRMSFIIIGFVSMIHGIYVKSFFKFLCASLLLFVFSEIMRWMSYNMGKRYIRELGEMWEAIKIGDKFLCIEKRN